MTKAKLATDVYLVPTGAITQWPTVTAPSGWLICDGSLVSRTTYAALFAVIGTQFGAGDGSTTFALPNLKGSVPVGYDGAQTEFNAMGKTGGAKTHTLATGEIPAHTHSVTDPGHTHPPAAGSTDFVNQKTYDGVNLAVAVSGTSKSAVNNAATGSATTSISINNAGGGGAHNNLQPYLTLSFIIRT